MWIDRVEASHLSLPLAAPSSDATHGLIETFSLVVVRIRTRDGLDGVGYTYTVGATGASAIASLIVNDLRPVLLERDPRATESLWQAMHRATHYVGRGGPASFAISAVDIALWDIKAKALREPLWRLLGGESPKVPAYAGGIDLNLPLPELEDQTRGHLEGGIRAIKMKVGRPRLSEDLVRVRAIRDLVGPDIPLMVDANTKWTVAEALRASAAFAEYDVYWLEEPTAPNDVAGHVRIEREGPVRIAAGENLHTLEEFEALISAGGVSFPEPDVTNCGGVTTWLKVAHLAESRNLPVTSHGAHELHVSLLASVPNASFVEIHGFGIDRFTTTPMTLAAGCAVAKEHPGHGIDFNLPDLNHYLLQTIAA